MKGIGATVADLPVEGIDTLAVKELSEGGHPPARRPADVVRGVGSRLLVSFAEWIVFGAVAIELVVQFANVITRSFLGFSIIWSQEVAELCLTVIAFIGGAIAYPRRLHTAVEVGVGSVPPKVRPYLEALAVWLVFATGVTIIVLSIPSLQTDYQQLSPILKISQFWFEVPLPMGMVLLCYFALERLRQYKLRALLGSAGGLALGLIIAWATNPLWGSLLGSGAALWSSLILLGLMIFVGVPIGFVLALTSLIYLYLSDSGGFVSVALGMQSGVSSFVLLAIPFFIVAGLIMTAGGLTAVLVRWAQAFVGHVRGGLLYVVVVVMYIFAGISGSKAADVAAVGTATKDMLAEGGYNREEGVAVLSGATVMGETVPPSLPMLVLGSVTTLSIGSLFSAGIIPALFIGAFLMALIFIRARRMKMPVARRASWGERVRASGSALPVLVIPVILIGGIVGGIATPTESSSVAVVYALVVTFLRRPRLTFAVLKDTGIEAAALGGMVLFIVSTATPFSQALTIGGVPQDIAGALTKIGNHAWLFLLVSIIVLIVMGELLEGLPAVLIFAPLLIPLAPSLGIDPLHYAIVILFAMGIGSFAPPIGIGLYVACAVNGTTMERSVRRFLPYLLVLVLGLIALAFIPEVTLWLPSVLKSAG